MPPQSVSVQDEEILEAVRALQGGASSDVFAVIYNRYRPALRSFFSHRCARVSEADDLAQNTLLRVFERIHQYRPEEQASFSAWLWTIAENVVRNAVRDGKAQKRFGETIEVDQEGPDALRAATPDPEQAALDRERTQVLREAIESLPDGMRRCAELRLFGFKYDDIARRMGIGLNSVRSQLFEARRRLKPVLDTYFQGVEF